MLTVGALLQYGKYQVEEVLAVKGSSATYRATQRDLNQAVVIKTVVPEYIATDIGIGRFLSEARRLAELQHPHIVRVGDCFVEHSRLFLVTAFLPGQNLAKKIAQGPIAVPDALRYIRQIAQAIALMHRNGLLHRDIKPSNMMLSEDQHCATLVDFNIARAILTTPIAQSTNQMTDSTSIGIEFTAPEPVLSPHLWTVAADIYGLAATLYALVTGKAPLALKQIGRDRGTTSKEEQILGFMPRLAQAISMGMATEMSERPSSVCEWLEFLPENDSSISLDGQASLKRPDLASITLAPTLASAHLVLGDLAQADSVIADVVPDVIPADSVQANSALEPTPTVVNDLDPTLAVLEHPQPLQTLPSQPVPNRKPQRAAQTSPKHSGHRTQSASSAVSSKPARFPRRALLLSAITSGFGGVAVGFFMKTQIFSALILPGSLSTLTPPETIPETIQETFPPTVGSQVSGTPSEPRFSEPNPNAPDPAGTAQTVPNASVAAPTATTDTAIENPDSLYKMPDSLSSPTLESPPYVFHSPNKDLPISSPPSPANPSFDAANPANLEPLPSSGRAETLSVEQSPASLPSVAEPTLP
jgi:serine/threonine protein kinase